MWFRIASVLLLGAVLPLAVTAHRAVAIIGPCNGCDSAFFGSPTVYGALVSVTDGTAIKANVAVDDAATQVSAVSYVLHVPVGEEVTGYSFQGSGQTAQSLSWVADQQPGTYEVETTVTDIYNAKADTSTSATNTLLNLCGSAQVAGQTNITTFSTVSLAMAC